MSSIGWWSLLPPLLAIVLAIATRQVFVSLLAGLWVGQLVLTDGNLLQASLGTLDSCVAVFDDAGNTRVILFCALVGSLIALMQRSGGVDGFVNRVSALGWARTPRAAGLLAIGVGATVFIESSISCLMTGAVARPIFDRLRLSREKLAYVCDTSSAPVCILIPLNGWGAFILAQLGQLDVEQPVSLLLRAVLFNFYAWAALALLLVVVIFNWDFGPMRRAQERARTTGQLHAPDAQPMIADDALAIPPDPETPRRARNMLVPLTILIILTPCGLAYTGLRGLPADATPTFWSVLDHASGSTAVFWAVALSTLAAIVFYWAQGVLNLRDSVEMTLKGAGALAPLAVLMIFAFAIGRLCSKDGLNTGAYVASLVTDNLHLAWVAPLVFVTASAIAFSTGTSWGTFAIMLPIALPIAAKLGAPTPLALAAVLGGGVFGDHCSPISDTTMVSSMAAASDHIDHVRTQLPYALVAGLIATALYWAAGLA